MLTRCSCIGKTECFSYPCHSAQNISCISFQGFAPFTSLPRRRKHPTKKKKRPLFSQHQVQTMENEFTKHRYITESKRAELSSELDLTETQVKTWFQNRRTKWRKELRVAMTMAQTHQTTQEKMRENSSSSQVELCLDNI